MRLDSGGLIDRKRLESPIGEIASSGAWAAFAESCFLLFRATLDSLDVPSWVPTDALSTPRRMVLDRLSEQARRLEQPIYWLRNRHAHPPDPKRRSEWVRLQRLAADALGRLWHSKSGFKHSEFFAPDDLELSSIEASELKAHCIESMTVVLSQMKQLDPAIVFPAPATPPN